MNNNQSSASNSDSADQSIVDVLIARQNAKLQRIACLMLAKHNKQTRFYLLMFRAVIAIALIVVVGCLIAIEMTVRVGGVE